MLSKRHPITSDSFPGLERSGSLPKCAAQVCTTGPKPTAIITAVIDSVFNKNYFTQQEQQIILMTIDKHTGKELAALWLSEWQSTKRLPDFITKSIANNKPIETEKLQALRKFTTEILDLQDWINEEMINEYLAAGYSKISIIGLKALARLAANNQQRRDIPCLLLELPCVTTNEANTKPS